MKILIMGLPGSGKTTLACALVQELADRGQIVRHVNGDEVRKYANDWDFSPAGRLRQAWRMGTMAHCPGITVCDFICPTAETLAAFEERDPADLIIWMDTVKSSRYPDTDALFQPPARYDVRVRTWASGQAAVLAERIVHGDLPVKFRTHAPTVQMLGRFQPWHAGHQALFERALSKTGQVCVMVRDMPPSDHSPFPAAEVERRIHEALEVRFSGHYRVQIVPNIVGISYGRDVGYWIEQEDLGAEIHAISATKIRARTPRSLGRLSDVMRAAGAPP